MPEEPVAAVKRAWRRFWFFARAFQWRYHLCYTVLKEQTKHSQALHGEWKRIIAQQQTNSRLTDGTGLQSAPG